MVMLCLQTSCHRCPSALHNRLVTSTPSLSPLSLIHHVRVDASSITEAPELACGAREPRQSREKRWRGHWPGRGGGIPVEEKRVVDRGGSGARGDGVPVEEKRFLRDATVPRACLLYTSPSPRDRG